MLLIYSLHHLSLSLSLLHPITTLFHLHPFPLFTYLLFHLRPPPPRQPPDQRLRQWITQTTPKTLHTHFLLYSYYLHFFLLRLLVLLSLLQLLLQPRFYFFTFPFYYKQQTKQKKWPKPILSITPVSYRSLSSLRQYETRVTRVHIHLLWRFYSFPLNLRIHREIYVQQKSSPVHSYCIFFFISCSPNYYFLYLSFLFFLIDKSNTPVFDVQIFTRFILILPLNAIIASCFPFFVCFLFCKI